MKIKNSKYYLIIVICFVIAGLFYYFLTLEREFVIYRCNEKIWEVDEDISLLSKETDYATDKSRLIMLNSHSSKTYLKYIMKKNKIKEQYVCFIISNELADGYDGVISGEYCLKGADQGVSYKENKKLLKAVFGEKYCTQSKYAYGCSVPGLFIGASADFEGSVNAGDDYYTCNIGRSRSSYCLSFE